MRDTSTIGNKSEAIVLAALVHAGYSTLLPFGGGHPYDIALDVGNKLLRVQCKTGRLLKEGVVFFPTASWCRNLSYRSYRGDVDLFGVYCEGTEQVYLVPIEDVPERAASLRVVPPKNGQAHGIRWAKDYVIWPVSAGKAGAPPGSGPAHGDENGPADGGGQLRLVYQCGR
jgi:hypothetical protein